MEKRGTFCYFFPFMVYLVYQAMQLKYPPLPLLLASSSANSCLRTRAQVHGHTQTHTLAYAVNSVTNAKKKSHTHTVQHVHVLHHYKHRHFNASEYYMISKLLIKQCSYAQHVLSGLKNAFTQGNIHIHKCLYTQSYQCRHTFPVFLLSHLIPHRSTHFQGLFAALHSQILSLLFQTSTRHSFFWLFFFCFDQMCHHRHHTHLNIFSSFCCFANHVGHPILFFRPPVSHKNSHSKVGPLLYFFISLSISFYILSLSPLSVLFPLMVKDCLLHLQQEPTGPQQQLLFINSAGFCISDAGLFLVCFNFSLCSSLSHTTVSVVLTPHTHISPPVSLFAHALV